MKLRSWLWLILLIPIVLGLTRLRFDTEILNLMPEELSAVQGIKKYQKHFSNARELILTVESPDAETTEAAARSLAEKLREQPTLVTDVIWQPPWLERPDLSAELMAFLWMNQPPEAVRDLLRQLEPASAKERLEEAKEALGSSLSPNEIARYSYDPFGLTELPADPGVSGVSFGEGQELFASADGRFRLVFIKSVSPLEDYRECDAFLSSIRTLVRDWQQAEKFTEVQVQYTGRPAFVAEIATGMEKDLAGPSAGTLLFIALLFYWVHRRWLPLLWLITLLALTLVATLAIGGFIFGTLSVVSLGFASILLGLGEDFGIVLYQESKSHPGADATQLRRWASPGIIWSAITTAGAFLVLNLGGLPGLGQLGTLVAVGIVLAALLMLSFFLPPLLRHRASAPPTAAIPLRPFGSWRVGFAWVATLGLLTVAAAFLSRHPVPFDASPDALKPKNSIAYATIERIKTRMQKKQEPLWILVEGSREEQVATRLRQTQAVLERAKNRHELIAFTLPTTLWPDPTRQATNRVALAELATKEKALETLARQTGFTTNALQLTGALLQSWKNAAAANSIAWPTNQNSRWILDQFTVRKPGEVLALGLVYLKERPTEIPSWAHELPLGATLSGWELIGPSLSSTVLHRLPKVLGLILGIVLISLWFAYRSFRDVLLSLALIVFSAIAMALFMHLFGWSWNMLNLMALPLLLGLGIDYGIHIQLALRRYSGDLAQVDQSIGSALLLAGTTTIAGFASLSFSSNAGLASLGKVSALGISCALITAVFLLPIWWKRFHAHFDKSQLSPLSRPSALYRSWFWQIALAITRKIPEKTLVRWSQRCSVLYGYVAISRRQIVVRNLTPVLNQDVAAARKKSIELFRNFGTKLAHLWRYECGLPIEHLFGPLLDHESYIAAQKSGRGILLLTPHLGNWEFGAPVLARLGIKLLVITLYEPNERLTEMRKESRARWGIETLVIGRDPFAFIEVIRRLEEGAVVALLVDRPPAGSSVRVEMFGRPFHASISPADLARATGCVLLPVVLPFDGKQYQARVLPEIPYDRPSLRRENRDKLTQEIMRAFEPWIVQYPDQWYHFVSVWPKGESGER